MVLIVAASVVVAYKFGLRTVQPGALPFAIGYFAIGIVGRLLYSEKFGHRGLSWLKSPLALYFGSRSYSIYLCHYPIVSTVAWLLFRWSVPSSMLILSIISIPLIIVTSELAYRWIEKPGIAAGKKLATLISPRSHYTASPTSPSPSP